MIYFQGTDYPIKLEITKINPINSILYNILTYSKDIYFLTVI